MRVSRSDVGVGMELAADVFDHSGRLLISTGTRLSERSIHALKVWGIPGVEVKGREADEVAAPALAPEEERQFSERFDLADLSHPFLRELYVQCLARSTRRGAES